MAGRSQRDVHQSPLIQPVVPRMPEGYYSGDQPNPNLRAFVERHMADHPYDPATDEYDVVAFNESQTIGNRRDAINDMHIYWSKKPYKAILDYILHYTQPGDLVLDPFSGSGSTALAALLEGRAAIAVDRSPAATFITKNYCTPVDMATLQLAYEAIDAAVKPEIDWLYETRCDRCDAPATTSYTVYSQVFQCSRCLARVPLFDCKEIQTQTKDDRPKIVNICPHCYEHGHEEIIRSQSQKFGAVPVMVSYLCQSRCKPARGERRYNDPDMKKRDYFERYDLSKIRDIESRPIPYWYPRGFDMTGFSRYRRDALYYYEVKEVSDLFTKRNLWALSVIYQQINHTSIAQDVLKFAFSGSLFNATRMYQQRDAGGGPQKGTFYIPQVFREVRCWTLFDQKVANLFRSADLMSRLGPNISLCVSTQSATNLADIQSGSTDYIFTDPPYADKVQYGELNFVWEAWLGLDTHWHDAEIIVNDERAKSETDWAVMMREAMAECYRVLKPGRWLSLCYHDTSAGTWSLVQDIMAETGFVPDTVDAALYIDTGQKTYNQLTADKVTKRDLVINFRKPRPGEVAGLAITGDEDTATFGEKVRALIREYLGDHPGESKDRVYDQVISRMVRAGRMEAHNFDELLRQVADEVREPVRVNLFDNAKPDLFGTHESSRWYLKEGEVAVVDAAESAKEDAAAYRLTLYMEATLQREPERDGLHYSDLFERYLSSVKDKPRREPRDWLLDYFYKTASGTYRLPASEEEKESKARARTAGTNRQIKRYMAFLKDGVLLPANTRPSNATLAEWIRQCKRTGLFEEGRLLFEKGGLDLDALPEAEMVAVEEDYAVCMRMLARAGQEKQAGKVKQK